uniref:Uncharacterized protein n=1 Tax=Chromera velia CCMP2878 TaxID=1169474 RepID=A0A0G4F289_9ALVE|eukprot:Cvel_14843.t1-p1 / transcript=Cvel_14843.t1 / gene=Cvel_14843 / organism=Chromera_velia_CCMP2878 / gene_product=ADP-ribosylation factor-like protein 5A, putative / transcript_product=ADP-ribosylation factor-like protein 5A, putative / location=Cvel_scaffold1072:22631-25887(-) / protein_length=225 / sequence_SO=supercontig / SO=protein_coding / is_pseudo=false
MGFFLSKMWRAILGDDSQRKILILGLNNAGKTTILYKLHLGQVIQTQPTIGSNVEEVTHKSLKLQVWDVGGQENLRSVWSMYFENAQALIFVVDSNDRDSMLVAKMELFNVLLHEHMKACCLLVLANKQDIQGAMTAAEICNELKLHDIRGRDWHIQGCCALTGDGLREGLDWIAARLQAASASSGPSALLGGGAARGGAAVVSPGAGATAAPQPQTVGAPASTR